MDIMINVKKNQEKVNIPEKLVLLDLFHDQVNRFPHEKAVIFNNKVLTYEDFNQLSNQFANYLVKQLDYKKDTIAVLLDRSIERMVTLFAILKAGCAYLPLNTEDPAQRLKFILEDSYASTLITSKKFAGEIKFPGKIIYIDQTCWKDEKKHNPDIVYQQSDLAYVIYTSGTTGKPKGVMIEQKAILNRILWMQKQYPLSKGDVILHKTPYTFDVSVWEIFWWSIAGASVSILNPGEHKDVMAIHRNIMNNKVTVMHFVPPLLRIFLDYIEANKLFQLEEIASLKYVFCSGEALNAYEVNKFYNLLYKTNDVRLINLYGPTEAAIDVTYYECMGDYPVEKVPIGKPIDNIQIYILDKNNNPCEIGQSGELCITGVGLARGYLNRPELNSKKFLSLPWDLTQKMYRTGDLALWLEDGNIEFLGRIDHQVKIHGNRIELGEIEALLLKDEMVRDVVVLAVDGKNGDKFLCAFIVPDAQFSSLKKIEKSLGEKLPDYMIPHQLIVVERIPLSTNGKTNRKALMEILEGQDAEVDFVDNTIWVQLIKIIKEKVNLKIAVNKITYDDTLEDIGIDSLSFLRIIIEIENKFNFNFEMANLNTLEFKTIGDVVAYIKSNIE